MKTRTGLGVVLGLIVVQQVLENVIGTMNRTLVEMPSWRHLGVAAWAAFSRGADLGSGRIIYPIAGIGGLALILAAAVVFRLGRRRPWYAAIPVYGSALMAICVMITTTQAAPVMLSLHRIGNDRQALQQAFDGFYRWDSIRAVIGTLEGCLEIWALVALGSMAFEKNTPSQEQPTVASSVQP